MPNYNRSDDPLGKDLKTLVKCSDDAIEPVCHELTISGNYKKTYYIGEKLEHFTNVFKSFPRGSSERL